MKISLGTSTALVAALTWATPSSAAGLSHANFAEYGAVIAGLLEQSTLTVASMSAGTLDKSAPSPRRALFVGKPGPQRTQLDCPGGGRVSSAYVDRDASGSLSAGDRFITIYEHCWAHGPELDGRYEFTIESHRHGGHDEITEVRFQFTKLGHAGMRWTGRADATLRTDLLRGTEHYVIRYRDLAVATGAHAMRWRFTLDFARPPFGAQVASLDGDLVIDGTTLALSQPDPFVFTRLKGVGTGADSGWVLARDAAGAMLDVVAQRGRYTYWYCPTSGRTGHRGTTPDCVEARSRPSSRDGNPADDPAR